MLPLTIKCAMIITTFGPMFEKKLFNTHFYFKILEKIINI